MDENQKFDNKLVDAAIENGINYLFACTVNGRWKGFPTLAGESDIWVTGFVLTHINQLCEQTNVIAEAQEFLLQSMHPSGGWSYSAFVPPDADSTAWCLQALQRRSKLNDAATEKAKAFLWSHFTGSAVSTYRADSGIREFIGAPSSEAIAGWTSAHPDVSAAAILADFQHERVREIIDWMIQLQTNDGFIHSYWWRAPQYATAILLRAISRNNYRLPTPVYEKILSALIREQLADGGFGTDKKIDAFTTALSLESFTHLSSLGHQRERINCGNALLLSRNNNGGWTGDYVLRIPAPYVMNPADVSSWNNADGGGNSFIEDKEGLFATAMACYALDCWRKTEAAIINQKEKTN